MPIARYRLLLDKLAAEIRSGRLKPGSRLPTHRQFAAQQGVALVTASRVYAELKAMGLISGETGRGSFVRASALPRGQGIDQHASAAGMLDLNFNYPALPGQAELLRTGLRHLASSGDLDALLRYQPHGGPLHERACVARHLAARGLTLSGEQVLIVDGAQHGLTICAMALLRPGDIVAVDALSYPGFKVLAEALHLELAPIPVRADGPDLAALAKLCQQRPLRAIYAMPTLHNPLGWVLDQAQRAELVAIARRHALLIIEDAAYAFLAEDPPVPLAAQAPECTVYVSGLSKSVATGLRVGFVAAPRKWIGRLERAIRATTWNTPGVMTALACAWLEDGTVARLEADKRADARARQAIATRVLGHLPCTSHPSSYFIWVALPDEARADRVVQALLAQGISLTSAEPFATGAQIPQALRVALGSVARDALGGVLENVRAAIDAQRYP